MQMRSVSGLVLFVLMAAGVGGAAAAELSGRQSMLLANNCLQCHARAGVPAPQIGDAPAWQKLAGKGEAALLASAVQAWAACRRWAIAAPAPSRTSGR
ncbi:hypothetical protein [Rugamonas sp. DEMB1]|uniref:hypothetical protein n=1 Tax=Rugamonas sp. DEMB1 TaxID=3039386 RepID=UPI0024483EDD|nr:hypothetical protein [Rugamonas sp. DEMB1]WGG51555.1 hypothetical protein QC826_04685 [Rugamonas sp. DEMB1]